MEGWIKLHRQILDNPFWLSERFTRGQAWVDLLLLANHTNGFFYLRDHKINVECGQVGYSILKLSKRWKWSRSKVEKFIKDLENEQQVVQQKSHSTSIITIVNYKLYQKKEQQVVQQKDNRKTTERQQKDTNKKEKKEKKEKNVKKEEEVLSSSLELRPPDNSLFNEKYEWFINWINTEFNRGFRGDKKSKVQFKARLKDKYTSNDWQKAMSNLKGSEFHKENGYSYITPEFLTRQTILEKWINAKNERIRNLDFGNNLKILINE